MKQTKGKAAAPPPAAPAVNWASYEATGFERTTTADLGIPFLTIVQKGSPEIDKTHKDYASKKVDGVEVGDIINTLKRKILSKNIDGHAVPVIFIPCAYERLFVEWKPRSSGGGFVRQHSSDAILSQCKRNEEDNRDYLPNGNTIVTTAYFYGLCITEDDDGTEVRDQVIIGMTSTQLKKARMWLNMAQQIRVNGPDGKPMMPPLFSHRYALTTIPENNADGSWMGWHIETAGMLTNQALITEAADVSKTMKQGYRPQLAQSTQDVPM